MVDAARFAKGMTFAQYVQYVGTPDNLKREGSRAPRKDWSDFLRKAYERARLVRGTLNAPRPGETPEQARQAGPA